MAMTEQLEEDEEIFKKLKIPWMPEEMHPVQKGSALIQRMRISREALNNTNIR